KEHKQTYSYLGVLEALSGAAVDVDFISFSDVRQNGVPEDLDVVLNVGDAGSAIPGRAHWLDSEVTASIRSRVQQGGGFVGIGEPSAIHHGECYFQLANVLGVDKELGYSLSTNKQAMGEIENHFITADGVAPNVGEGVSNVYSLSEETEVLDSAKQ